MPHNTTTSNSNPFPMGGDFGFGSSSQSGGSSFRAFSMSVYKGAVEATQLAFHCLVMVWVDALFHMGWSAFNPSLGFKLPDASAGSKTNSGFFPHWLQSFPTWLQCWAEFGSMLDAKGGHPELRGAMASLQTTITSMATTHEDAEYGWLIGAHVIMARVHNFCTTMDPKAIGAPLSLEEERKALTRARLIKKPYVPRDTHGDNAGPRSKKPRSDFKPSSNNKGGKKQGGCPFHPGTNHPIEQCRKFLELAKKHSSGSSDNSG